MRPENVRQVTEDVRWRVGVWVFCVLVAVGSAGAFWVLQELRSQGTRTARQDAQALAHSVAQTLAHQLGRAVRLGIPLAELPGVPAYLDNTLRRQPMLTHIAIEAADGTLLHGAGKALDAAAGAGEVSVPIAGAGAGGQAGAVRIGVDPSQGVQRQQARANGLAAVLVVALAGLAALAAAWGPGARLERQRRALVGQLLHQGAESGQPSVEGMAHGAYGLPALEQALAQGHAHVESERRAMQHYAHELLTMDFDGRMRAEIDRLVPGLAAAADQEG